MAPHQTIRDVYGPGTFTDTVFTPVPEESRRLLDYFAKQTSGFSSDPAFLNNVTFSGQDLPLLPGPIKAQAFSAVCQAMIGLGAKEICELRGIETGSVCVDTDLAALYPATVGIVDIDGKIGPQIEKSGLLQRVGLDLDKGLISKSPMRYRSWAIYLTREENVWFQFMSSLDPVGYLHIFGLDGDDPSVSTNDEAYEKIKSMTTTYSGRELEHICIEHGVVGQICLTPHAWRESSMGKALARHPLINYSKVRGTENIPPVPFPTSADQRPLAGIKVVELSRVIAGPTTGATLAALGADVIKVQSPDLPDMGFLSVSLSAGKRVSMLDLTREEDRAQLLDLLQDADVVGPKAPERPGYQQIADAASGCCYVMGKAYGLPEGTSVLPSLPIADMLTGAIGALVTLLSLRDRARHGGAYHAHVALTSIDTAQLEEEVGLYPPQVVQQVQDKYQFQPMLPQHNVPDLANIIIEGWMKKSDVLKRDEFFVQFETAFGKQHKILAPAWKFEQQGASPRWTSGPVPNGGHVGRLPWLSV